LRTESTKFWPTKIATSPLSQLAVAHLGQLHDDEQRVPVLLDLGPLVPVPRILDGQFVQVELLLHLAQFVVGRVAQGHPDEAVRLEQPSVDVLDGYVGELAAVLVGHAVDQHRNVLLVFIEESSHASADAHARQHRAMPTRLAMSIPSPAHTQGCLSCTRHRVPVVLLALSLGGPLWPV
jgi:hypothetical protein